MHTYKQNTWPEPCSVICRREQPPGRTTSVTLIKSQTPFLWVWARLWVESRFGPSPSIRLSLSVPVPSSVARATLLIGPFSQWAAFHGDRPARRHLVYLIWLQGFLQKCLYASKLLKNKKKYPYPHVSCINLFLLSFTCLYDFWLHMRKQWGGVKLATSTNIVCCLYSCLYSSGLLGCWWPWRSLLTSNLNSAA